jgi:hypothetical protein
MHWLIQHKEMNDKESTECVEVTLFEKKKKTFELEIEE